jgi:hypothetical protein
VLPRWLFVIANRNTKDLLFKSLFSVDLFVDHFRLLVPFFHLVAVLSISLKEQFEDTKGGVVSVFFYLVCLISQIYGVMLMILKGEPAAVKSLVFCVVLPRSLFVIVVSVRPFTGFDYPFVNRSFWEIITTLHVRIMLKLDVHDIQLKQNKLNYFQ